MFALSHKLRWIGVLALLVMGILVGCGDDIVNNYYISPADGMVIGETGPEPSDVNGAGTTAARSTGDTCNISAPVSFDAFHASAHGPLCFAALACPSEFTGMTYDDCVDEGVFYIDKMKDEAWATCRANFNPNAAVACFQDICDYANNCTPLTIKSESSAAFPSCASVCGSDTPAGVEHPLGY